MTEIWGGAIVVDDIGQGIEDVHLWATTSSNPAPISSNASLRLLSNVHVPSIPLYLAVGPSMLVSSRSQRTASWFCQNLLVSDEEIQEQRDLGSGRYDYGVLLRVEDPLSMSEVTEILLYAATESISDLSPATVVSEKANSDGIASQRPLAPISAPKVYALPLCSSILDRLKHIVDQAVLKQEQLVKASKQPLAADNDAQKRQKISDLFEDASKARRKQRGHGGARISKAIGCALNSSKDLENVKKAEIPSSQAAGGSGPINQRRKLSRAATTTATVKFNEARPPSMDPVTNGHRSSLSWVESIISPQEGSIAQEVENGVFQQNREALTKVILAGMRLHGLQNKKKLVRGAEVPASQTINSNERDDSIDEYKSVYHQTFKAAAFTFRAHFNIRLISQDLMREVVDRLLDIFCLDPFLQKSMATGFGSTPDLHRQEASSSLDLPRMTADFDMDNVNWTTPSKKARTQA